MLPSILTNYLPRGLVRTPNSDKPGTTGDAEGRQSAESDSLPSQHSSPSASSSHSDLSQSVGASPISALSTPLASSPEKELEKHLGPNGAEEADNDAAATTTTMKAASANFAADLMGAPAFNKWRPSYHFIAPYGWMNDPCAPYFDRRTGLYHLFFEWNPQSADWGNMSWGHATSSDLVHWTRINHVPASNDGNAATEDVTRYYPALEPETPYDHLGIFTGCALARPPRLASADAEQEEEEEDDGVITAIYTSVSHLPIHHTLPYTRGSESLSIATSKDGGRTWLRAEEDQNRPSTGRSNATAAAEAAAATSKTNPILSGPPEHLEVTSWRDPYVSKWPALDSVLKRKPGEYLYGIIAGGLRAKEGQTPRDTPTAFLYSIPIEDLSVWEFEGTLFDLGFQLPQGTEQGDWGKNFEVCNVIGLPVPSGRAGVTNASEEDWQISVINAESCLPTSFIAHPCPNLDDNGPDDATTTAPSRLPRRAMWMKTSLALHDGTPRLTPEQGGPLDWGCLYAANTVEDTSRPGSGRRIMWGWIPDDDLSKSHVAAQGWQGCLALPRLLTVQETIAFAPVTQGTNEADAEAEAAAAEVYAEELRSFGNLDAQVFASPSTSSAGSDVRSAVRVRTLGIEPLPEVVRLREGAAVHQVSAHLSVVDARGPSRFPALEAAFDFDAERLKTAAHTLAVKSRCWEAEVEFDWNSSATNAAGLGPAYVGLFIGHEEDGSQGASIVFDVAKSCLSIHRAHSTSHVDINTSGVDGGPLRLLRTGQRGEVEGLKLRVFLDNSVLEVYANGRWACSSRIYPEGGSSSHAGLSAFCTFEQGDAHSGATSAGKEEGAAQVVVEGRVWEHLQCAFPR